MLVHSFFFNGLVLTRDVTSRGLWCLCQLWPIAIELPYVIRSTFCFKPSCAKLWLDHGGIRIWSIFWRKSLGRTNPPLLRGSKHCSYDKNGLVKEGLKYGLTGNTLECVQHGHSLRVEYDNDVTNHGSRVKGVWVIRYGNLPTPFGTVGPIHGDSYHLKVWPLGSVFDFSISHFQTAVLILASLWWSNFVGQ